MPEMFNVLAPDEAFQVLRQHVSPLREREVVPSAEALGRVTAEAIRSPEDLPAFPRSSPARRRHPDNGRRDSGG